MVKVYFVYENGQDAYTEGDVVEFYDKTGIVYCDGEVKVVIPIEKIDRIES